MGAAWVGIIGSATYSCGRRIGPTWFGRGKDGGGTVACGMMRVGGIIVEASQLGGK